VNMAAPQLRLEVSLNLAGFRNEVRKLTQVAQSEFNPLLTVKVNTQDYRAQLKALEKIKPVIKIEDSQIDAARARIGTLNKSLATLRRATSTPIEIKLKYVEVGKPPSTAAGQIGQAVSGRIRADEAVAGLNQKQAVAARNMLKAANVPVSGLGTGRSLEAYQKSIVEGITKAGDQAIAGLTAGLKDGKSEVAQAAKLVGEGGLRALKDFWGIASPSRVFNQIGEFAVDGLELGFLNGLKDFKNKSVNEVRKITALLKLELAKVSDVSGIGGPSMGSLRRQLLGQRAYTSPIGPQPLGSKTPWAAGSAGQFGSSGYEPRTVSRPYTGAPRFPTEGMMAPRSEFSFASTGRGSMGQFPMDPMLAVGGASAMGQKIAGPYPFSNTARSARGGYFPGISSSLFFPMSGMMGPSSPVGGGGGGGGTSGGGAGGSGGGGGGAFGGMRLNVPQLPGSGVVRELGEEFGFAAKQVLLFGTAYKALAFLQGFPGQVGNAVGALQSFRNTLKTVTPSAAEFDKSSKFILSLVDQYNVPLQAARDGFAKLYASMKPAGFSGAEIRGLFEGVSMGAATFGMSADKVDRVMYAFAQMASKGQVMSEELKGQLGDVLPGALSLFARAADMSVQEFGQAMEDGAFKGEAMRQLLINVGATMKEEFGKGAVGAAVTYQGVMNRLQTTTVLFYEAFEPAAVAFANTFILPITNGIRIVTDAFTQLLTGQQALTQGGSELAANMQPLIPIFQGIGDNLKQVATAAVNTVKALMPVVQFLLQLAASPVVGFLAQKYASLLLLNGAFTLLGGRLLIGVIASLAQTAVRMTALNAATLITNSSLAGTQLQLRMLSAGFAQTGAAATGFAMTIRTAMMTTVVGAIVAAVAIGIAEFMRLRGVMASIEGRYKSLGDQARLMGEAGNASGVQKITAQVKEQAQTYEDLAKALNRAKKAGGFLKLDQKGRELLERTGQSGFDVGSGVITTEEANKIKDAINKNRRETRNLLGSVLPGQESKARTEAAKLDAKLNKKTIDLSAGDGTGKPLKEKSLESYYGLQDQLAKAQTQADIERLEAAFEHARAIINAEYDLKEAKANSFQKKAIAFQKEIFAITSEQDAALFKNRNKVLAAAGSVAGGAGGGGKGLGAGIAQYITGDPASPFYKADHGGGNYHEHLAFVSRQAAEEAYKKLTSAGIKVTEFKGKSKVGGHTPGSAHYKGLAFDVPGSQVPVGQERGLTARVQSILGIGGAGSTPGKVTPSRKRDELAEQQVVLAAREMNAAAAEKEAEAIAKLEIATANYVQSLLPTAEQSLQNQLLQQRITLTQNSFSPEILEAQLAFAEQELQVAESIKINTEEINRLTAASGNNAKGIKALTDANNQLKANLPVSAIQLLTKAIDDQVLSLVQRTKTAERDAADQERVNGLIIGGMTRQAAEAKVTAENLRSDYKKALEEATRQVEIAAAAEEVLAAAMRLGKKETAEQTAEYNRLAQALKDAKDKKDALEGRAPEVEGAATGIESSVAPKTTSSYIADGLSAAQEKLDQLTNTGYQVVQAANSIGDAFGTAFKGVITGSMTAREALAGMFQSVADHFADMVAQMIAEYLKMALIKGIMSIIGGAAGALGGGLSGAFGASGPSFNAGAFSGPALSSGAAFGGAGAGSFSGAFSGGAAAFNPAAFSIPKFANGGVVTGPTLGLVGEGRYNEAVIPLPDGKSVPVQLSGGDGGNQMNTNITVNVSNGQAQSNATGSNSSELGRKIEGAVKQVIVGELRPGGLLASR
jgi:tape measure domain-containing protein